MDRRDFLMWSSLAGAAAMRQRGPVVRIVLLTAAGAPPRASEMGVRMSVEEVERSALLFGGEIRLTRVTGDARVAATAGELATIVKRERTAAIIGGAHPEECAALARVADRQGTLYFNVSSSDDALRGAECRPTTFHVIPSAAMYRDALARAEPPAESDARCVAWDASLVRFGADTLNQRFHTRYGQAMSGESWTGWLAVKMLWESALRAKTAEPSALAALLTRDATRFDGHKGRALTFRAWDHQLRQPVYVLTGNSTIEIPAASNAGPSSALVLDELGVSADRTACRWAR
jgi:ABC-type branched-subunit amino acid transport system substrate-binding protein